MGSQLLSTVASQPFEDCEAEWREVLRSLRLGLLYVPAIQSVLKEGRWKNAPNPIAYVRKSAVRAAVRMGIVDIRPNQSREILACDLQFQDEDGHELEHDDKLGMALHRYEEKFGLEYNLDSHSAEDRLPEALFKEVSAQARAPAVHTIYGFAQPGAAVPHSPY